METVHILFFPVGESQMAVTQTTPLFPSPKGISIFLQISKTTNIPVNVFNNIFDGVFNINALYMAFSSACSKY